MPIFGQKLPKSPMKPVKSPKIAEHRHQVGILIIIHHLGRNKALLRKIRISERPYALSVLTVPLCVM